MLNSEVLDTLLIKDGAIFLREFHIDRSFEALEFSGKEMSRANLEKIYSEVESKFKDGVLRIVFSEPYHAVAIELTKLPTPVKLSAVFVTPEKGSNYKWSDRKRWNQYLGLKLAQADDILTVNSELEIVETSRCNVFAYDELADTALTPPLSSGCVNGVYRRYALSLREIELPGLGVKPLREQKILFAKIQNYKLFVANSVREVLGAEFIPG